MTIADRVDLAAVSDTVLEWYLLRFPEYRSEILISDIYDTENSRHFVLPQNSIIKVHEINNLLELADQKGLLLPIDKKYGLVKSESFLNN